MFFAIFFVLVVGLAGSVSAEPNLVAYYDFETGSGDIAYDRSGYGTTADGTLCGDTAWTDVSGSGKDVLGNYALYFDDNNDVVKCGDPAKVKNITGAITVAAWVKIDHFTKKWQTVVSKYTSWWIRRGTGPVSPYPGTDDIDWWVRTDTSYAVTHAENIQDNTWHHIAGTYDSATGKSCVYTDGVLSDSAALTGSIYYDTRELWIGADGSGDNVLNEWKGLIDEVRIYNRALSQDEIAGLLIGDPTLAHYPNPSGDEPVSPAVVLSWTPGVYASSHDVYFGTDFNSVNDASRQAGDLNGSCKVDWADLSVLIEQWLDSNGSGLSADLDDDGDVDMVDFAAMAGDWMEKADAVFKGNQDANSYEPPETLEFYTTYHWRVDEVNDTHPNSPWRGHIWGFTTQSEPNLVARWAFDEGDGSTAYDSSGYGNPADGTIYGDTQWEDSNTGNYALYFDDDDDVVKCGDPAKVKNITNAITVMAWVKMRNFTRQWQTVVSKYQSWWIRRGYSYKPYPDWFVRTDTSSAVAHAENIQDNEWHHLAGTYDSATGKMYVYTDGVLSDSNDLSGTINDSTSKLWIGADQGGDGIANEWKGLIDDVRIYNRALSANYINDIFQDGLAGHPIRHMPDSGTTTASYIIFHDDGSPKYYYAKEGGTGKIEEFSGTDANTVINDAISALGGNGGKIFFKSGEYIITSDITMPHNVFLIGESAQTTTLYFKNGCGIKVNENGTPKKTGAVKNFYIDGYQAGDSNGIDGTAILVENVNFFEVENCQFEEFDTCLELKGACYFSRIKGNRFAYYHEYGVHMCSDSAGRNPNALWIENNEFAGGRGDVEGDTQAIAAIYIERGGDCVASDNYFETSSNYIKHWIWLKHSGWKITNSKFGAGPADNSIQIETPSASGISTTHTTIIGCKVFGDGGNSIYVDMSEEPDPRFIKLCGCLLYGRGTIDANSNGKVRFHITNTYFKADNAANHLLHLVESGNVIVGNHFYTDENYDLIHTEDINDSVIADNVFLGGADGIELPSSSRNNAITGNTFRGQSNAAINISGAGTTNIIRDNVGYVTEGGGTATGTSPITVAHGLAGTPTSVILTPRTSCKFSVTSRNGTSFVITHDAGTSVTFDWNAKYKP